MTKAYIITNTEQYNTYAGAVNAAGINNKPMKYASATIQNDLDFTGSAPICINQLYGRLHGNGHTLTLGSASTNFIIVSTVNEDGVVDYLDVDYPSNVIRSMVSYNYGRVLGCNVTRGVAAERSAGLVNDCYGELHSDDVVIHGRYTRCLMKKIEGSGVGDYRLYNSNVAINELATYEDIAQAKSETGELAYTLSHGNGNTEWGQELGVDADPRIHLGQTPASDTYVTRLTSYSVGHPEGVVEYMNAGLGLEAAPGYYKVCEDTESWTSRPAYNFIMAHNDGTYSAELINLDPTAQHFLPFEVEAELFSFRKVDAEGKLVSPTYASDDIVSLMFPVGNINGKVYLFRGYNDAEEQLEFAHDAELDYIPANTPMLVVANEGNILLTETYGESYPLAVSSMTQAGGNKMDDISHLAGYSQSTIPTVTGMGYYRLSEGIAHSAVKSAGVFRSPAVSLTAQRVDAGTTVNAFDSYFAVPTSTTSGSTVKVALINDSTTELTNPDWTSEAAYPCEIWTLGGCKVLTVSSGADIERLSRGIYIRVSQGRDDKVVVR